MDTTPRHDHGFDYDVVIVGGGPAGCSTAVFTAREGLDTCVFDRGRSSIRRCAHLENYLGFPAGIDVDTFYGLMHDHAERAGCEVVPDLVESVTRNDDGPFRVRPQEGDPVTANRVVAATRYDGEYLRGLDDAMFETYEHDGEEHERFDRDYPDRNGSTPIEGLYIASPADEADTQAIVVAGRGVRVAHRVIADARIDDGWWNEVAEGVDWMRREANLDGEWSDRETWVEWFDDYYGEDAPVDPDSERFERVRETYIDERLSTYLPERAIEERSNAGHEAVAAHLDPGAVVRAVGAETLVEEIDDETLLEAVDDETLLEAVDDEVLRERIRTAGPVGEDR
jgi:hypothetical protein